jgi:hypothetical protein
MPSHLSSPWNNAVEFLSMFYGVTPIADGSCFFWAFENRTYLVTNWHNLSGRNPLTDKAIHSWAAIPDRVQFWVYKRMSEPDAQGDIPTKYPVDVKLCESDWSEPNWFEHPTLGRRVDVAAIDVTEAIEGFQINHANSVESDAVLDVTVSQDVFVIGFPFGKIANAPAPVWKRGTVALDPTFDPEGLPKMFVDTATREGMSGSVVVAKHIIAGREYLKKDRAKSGTL